MNTLRQFTRRQHQCRVPVIARADIHVLDESHDDAGAAKAFQQIEQGVIVHAALHDGIHLDGCEPGAARMLDAIENFGYAAESTAHAGEYLGVERVEADGNPP